MIVNETHGRPVAVMSDAAVPKGRGEYCWSHEHKSDNYLLLVHLSWVPVNQSSQQPAHAEYRGVSAATAINSLLIRFFQPTPSRNLYNLSGHENECNSPAFQSLPFNPNASRFHFVSNATQGDASATRVALKAKRAAVVKGELNITSSLREWMVTKDGDKHGGECDGRKESVGAAGDAETDLYEARLRQK